VYNITNKLQFTLLLSLLLVCYVTTTTTNDRLPSVNVCDPNPLTLHEYKWQH